MTKRSKGSKLKNSTVLSRSDDALVEPPALKMEAVSNVLMDPDTPHSTTAKLDPLEAVTAFPEVAVSEEAVDASSPQHPSLVTSKEPYGEAHNSAKSTPWDYPAKLIALSQANTACITSFSAKFAGAKTPQDIIAATSNLYAEQGRLLKQNTEDLIKLLSCRSR